MTLTDLFNYVVNFVNENPKTTITTLIAILEVVGRNVKSERNLSILQNFQFLLNYILSGLDSTVPNKTATPNVAITTELVTNRVQLEVEDTEIS